MPNRFGACGCCGTPDCTPIDVADLPTITISGWTGLGWTQTGNGCCWTQCFTKDETTWSWSCPGVIHEAEFSEYCETNLWTIQAKEPLRTTTTTCPLPTSMCCGDTDKQLLAEIILEAQKFVGHYPIFFYTPFSLCVQYSHETVDCGLGPELKWVLKSSLSYQYVGYVMMHSIAQAIQTATFYNSCFTETKDHTFDITDGTAFTCPATQVDADAIRTAALGATVGGGLKCAGISSGTCTFDRIKFYDAEPTGTVTFTNSDLLGSCTLTQCQEGSNYTTSCCATFPALDTGGGYTNPNCDIPCVCDGLAENTNYEVFARTTGTVSNSCYHTNCSTPPSPGQGTQYAIVGDCNSTDPDFGCQTEALVRCCNNGQSTDCFSYDLIPCLGLTDGTEDTSVVNQPWVACDEVLWFQATKPYIDPAVYAPVCGNCTGVGGASLSLPDCSDPADCDPVCCYYFDCLECPDCNNKWTGFLPENVAYSSTVVCSGQTTRQGCISAPSWSITLS